MISNEEMEVLWKKEQEKYKAKYVKFYGIVVCEILDLVGNSPDISIECDHRGITILVKRSSVLTFLIEGDCFLLSHGHGDSIIRLSNLDTFREVVRQLIVSKLIPFIYDLYKRNFILTLPCELVKEDKKLDFSKLTVEWIVDKFYEISENCSNGETIDNVVIKENSNNILFDFFNIEFDVDCNRYGVYKGCTIKINDKGYVKVDLSDTPIEGGGIESKLVNEISKLIGV